MTSYADQAGKQRDEAESQVDTHKTRYPNRK
jgi:hypothetical protein